MHGMKRIIRVLVIQETCWTQQFMDLLIWFLEQNIWVFSHFHSLSCISSFSLEFCYSAHVLILNFQRQDTSSVRSLITNKLYIQIYLWILGRVTTLYNVISTDNVTANLQIMLKTKHYRGDFATLSVSFYIVGKFGITLSADVTL